MFYWMFMIIAIITEVIGTLAMKYGVKTSTHLLGIIIMYIMLILSYTSLAIAVKRIPLAVAYGAWESLGLILIALFSYFLFAEPLGTIKIIAIVVIIIGIVLLEHGTEGLEH